MKGERKIVADTVITHVAPSTGAALDDTLYFGNTIEILMTVPYTEVRNNMVSPWLKVIYQKGKYKKIGFISAIDIALNDKLVYKNYEFVWGVVTNDKKDLVSDFEIINFNNYKCKLFAIQDSKRVAEKQFEMNENIKLDSFTIKLINKTKLSKTICAIEIQNINIVDTTAEFYNRTFVLCESLNIVQLPITHNYSTSFQKKFPASYINLCKNKNNFTIVTDYLKMMPEKIIDTYKWQNCNYTLIK